MGTVAMVTYIVVGVMGLMLMTQVPDSDVRWQRLTAQGGSALLFGIGLFGSVYSYMAAA